MSSSTCLMAERLVDKSRRGPLVTQKRHHNPFLDFKLVNLMIHRTHSPDEPKRIVAVAANSVTMKVAAYDLIRSY